MKKTFVFLLITLSSLTSAKTYYVATNGNNNNPGTISQPWLTWQKAFSTAQAGDTVFFRGGVYPISRTNGQGIGMDPRYPQLGGGYDGTRENPICYFNYPGETPILDCQAAVTTAINNRGIFIQTLDHTIFRGLTIRNVRQNFSNTVAHGIEIYWSNNVHFINCTVHNIGGVGIGISDNDTIYLTNCDAYNCCDSLSAFKGNGGDGMSVGDANNNDPSAAVFFKGCRAWNVSDDGFGQFFDGYIEYDSCWAFNNGYLEGDGNSFKHSRSDLQPILPLARKLTHCISANNKGVWGGYVDNSNGFLSLNSEIYNCVSYNENYGFTLLGYSMGTWSGGNIYKNNIAFSNSKAEYYDAFGAYKWVHDHNSWDYPSGLELTDADFISLDWTELQKPRKADGSLPDINFMKLDQGSDLIDAGTDVGLSFSGSAPDLGWSESSSTSSIPASPVYVSSVIQNATPSRLEMTYSLSLANIVPATSAFVVKVNNVTRTVNSVAISGTKVLLTLSNPVIYGEVVTVAYTKPASNPIQTTSGGQAATIPAQSVTNNVAAVIPVYVSSVVENATPAKLEITYNLSLANIIPASSAFSVRVNSVTRTVSAVAISGTKVMLTLASPVIYGDVVTVAYTKPASNPLQSASDGQVASITAQNVTNNVAAVIPGYVSSVIQDASPARLEMTYNLTLANIVPSTASFTVKVNNVTRSVSAVAISGTKVLLTLASPVIYGDVVTVAYTKPASNPIQTAVGGQAASITAQNVINNVAAINNQPPVVSISSPTKSTSFITPATITIDANASDPDGSVTKVEFYNGTSRLGEFTSAPYSYTWKEVEAGTYSITAAATDNKGLRTVSTAVTVVVEKSATVVNQLPSVSIKIPNEKKPRKHDNVVIIAEASDPDGTISKVELKSGNVTIAETTTAPYVFTLQNVDTGNYVITATATDNLGAVSTSDAIELRVEDFYNPDLIRLYPNPNNGLFKIDILEELPDQQCILSIVDLTGTTVYQDKVTTEEISKEISLPDLQFGPYVLMLTNGNTILTTKKFIKQ